MRQYIISAPDSEKIIREQRVKSSIADIGNDLMAQKTFLSLEPIPKITNEMNKGKGPVFEFGDEVSNKISYESTGYHTKLLASAIQAAKIPSSSAPEFCCSEGSANNCYDESMAHLEFSSVNSAVNGEAGSSGTANAYNISKPRRHPPRSKRQNHGLVSAPIRNISNTKTNTPQSLSNKRKTSNDTGEDNSSPRKALKVVPTEGPPKGL